MKNFLLIDIQTSSEKPKLNINRIIQTSSAKKAALIFMSLAFAENTQKVTAFIRVQNETGNIKRFLVKRVPVTFANAPTKYKHYIV